MRDVIAYYSENSEENRLSTGLGLMEFARTREIVQRHLPADARVVLDVGGATGVYSEWLAGIGREAHLIDLTPSHVAAAGAKGRGIASACVGDARALPWPGASFDAVLLFGPLYHLTERDDRVRALNEARRVVRPRGLVFAAAITRFASLLAALVDNWFDDPASKQMLDRDLLDGQHRNAGGTPDRFTTAFFHKPAQLCDEVQAAGLDLIETLPVEGPCWMATGSTAGFVDSWNDPRRRERLLDLVRRIERDPDSLVVSPHILAVARR